MTATLAPPELICFADRSENTVSSQNRITNPFKFPTSPISSQSMIWGGKFQLIQELRETFYECSIENWDGYEALPLKKRAVQEAESFISNMPMLMPIPELVPEPSGDIGFQWSFGENRVLTVSFEGNNTVTYACILGSSKRTKYGTEIFNDRIPQEVVQGIEAIRL